MQELATLDASAAEYRRMLEEAQGMVKFVTGRIDALRHLAAHQRREWGSPILPH